MMTVHNWHYVTSITSAFLLLCCSITTSPTYYAHAFSLAPTIAKPALQKKSLFRSSQISPLRVSNNNSDSSNENITDEESSALQWKLMNEHHVNRRWKGTWTSLDYMGDVIDETLACVSLLKDNHSNEKGEDAIHQTHEIVVGGKVSDCATCFDSFETQTMPVATYRSGGELISKYKMRFASVAMVNGPKVLRSSGTMTTELVLKHGDGRVRVIFYHAPAWKNAEDEYQTPPDALKFYRAMYVREADRDEVPNPKQIQEQRQMSADDSSTENKKTGNPKFFRPVPPFSWHKKWGGTSWTWGPTNGDQGWMIDEMEEADAWHGRPRGDSRNVWSMRLPGGILIQCPRIISPNEVELCRLAWLPEDEVLLRVEASIKCLEPVINDNDEMIGLYPPKLAALRCDVLEMRGEVDEAGTMLERLKELGEDDRNEDGTIRPSMFE